ncbi:RHS repeat domain-containing protein [Paenibacillus arenilitoris]|uniref:Type IV secretion protein Rhs n=1 Tax=Paenibacillus arenilitoris TaxID=2772299 RepID=A0A927CQH0_9BACL|nr:RHS repeat-associated core domain-containing protein [Paenibacillus arenilitoris]MBD2871222.1 type IV secretion protein Rhs [Paenibacillus arenilitoris]
MLTYRRLIRHISIVLIITFFIGLMTPYGQQTIKAEGETNSNSNPSLTIETVINRFSVTEQFIQQYMDSSYTLSQIYSALFKAEIDGIPFEDALQIIFAREVNLSSTVTGEVYNELSSPALRDLVIVEFEDSTVSGQVYEPIETEQPIESPPPSEEPTASPAPTNEPAESPAPTDITPESPAPTEEPTTAPTDQATEESESTEEIAESSVPTQEATNSPISTEEPQETPEPTEKPVESPLPTDEVLEGIEVPNMNALADEPVLETAPVYDKTTINEAPYSVGINNESISSLSGSLSTRYTDMTLPGRGGLSFSLVRQYNSSESQFYDMEYGSQTYSYGVYHYYVQYNAVRKRIMHQYQVKYNEAKWVQEDYDGNGSVDYNTFIIDTVPKTRGTYSTQAQAEQVKNQPLTFNIPADSITRTDTRSKPSSNDFASSVMYSQNGYSGALYKTGAPYVTAGSYTPADSKTATSSCENSIVGRYNQSGIWEAISSGTSCPSSINYSGSGYTGTLSRTTTDVIKACPTNGQYPYQCTKSWRANYSGTVTKPAVDTRTWTQNYRGTVTKPGYTSSVNYGPWQSNGSGRWRYAYQISGSQWVEALPYEAESTTVQLVTPLYEYSSDATTVRNEINSSPGASLGSENGYNYYVSNSPNAEVRSYQVGTGTGVTYFNDTAMPLNEKLYPIGKGWSWSLPHVESEDGKRYVNLADGGRYEVEGNKLKGYKWEGLSFTTDTSVTVNGEVSSHVLTTVDGRTKQYFAQDGRILQISDAYDNTIQFFYTQNAAYGRKLLSQIKDAIGNTIQITYTNAEVTISNGTETITYKKHTEEGIELLDSVTDAEGRLTSYSYKLASAKFNLMTSYPERAKTNPYALLWKIQHPTGAKTEYTYEQQPVTRRIGTNSVQEAYRVVSRLDQLVYETGETRDFNRHTMNYNSSDVGQSYGQDHSFSTSIDNGLTQTTYRYKKDYIDDQTPSVILLEEQTERAREIEKKTTYAYDKKVGSRTYPVSVPTTTTQSNNQNSDIFTSSAQYDDYGNVLQSTNANGITTTYTYDPVKKWMLSERMQVDANRFTYTSHTRNTQGDITQTTIRNDNESGAILQQISYNNFDSHGNVTSITVLNGDKSTHKVVEYDASYLNAFPTSQSVTVTNADNETSTITTRAEYDRLTGNVTASIDGNNNRTEYKYDKLGRIKQVLHPDGKILSAAYDDTLNTVTITDVAGNRTLTRWNGLGWKEEEGVIDNEGYQRRVQLVYDPHGRVIESKDALDNRVQMEYDAWSRPTKTIEADNSESITTYNDALRIVTRTDAVGYTQHETYDKFGRLEKVEEQSIASGGIRLISQNVYDPVNGLVVQQTDANNETTTFAYDQLGQLSKVTNAMLESTSYAYDMAGNLIETTYPDGNKQLKEYDELGRLIRSTDPLQKSDTIYYDANGNRIRLVDKAGQVFHYTYNNRNYLMSKQGPSETISFTFTDNGSRETMTDGTGTTQYTYKPHTAELESVIYPDGKTIAYSYDDQSGRLLQMTTPFSDTVGYTYNNRNQLENVSWNDVVQENYNYYANGQLSFQQQANGMQTEYSYTDNSLTNLKFKTTSGEVEREYGYGYDSNRNITSLNESNHGLLTSSDTFSYDPLSRISTSSEYNEAYAYDNRGNRQTMSTDSDIGFPKAMTYEYDEWDRLKKVTNENGETVTYRYNGDNLLVERQENGVITRYYYDGQLIVSEGIVQPNGEVIEKVSYLRGNGGLTLQENGAGEKGYYLHNGHGDVVGIRDEAGAVLNEYDYDIWGNTLEAQEQVDNSFRYSGELWDETTELQYLRARWYDPSVGRFINEDTYEGELSNPLSQNLYTYVHNNPLIYVDPTGNYCVSKNGNWAHGGSCNSSSSVYMGSDNEFSGHPIIENGKRVGYLGTFGPYLPATANYWSSKQYVDYNLTRANNMVAVQQMYEMQMFMEDITGVSSMKALVDPNTTPLIALMSLYDLVGPGPNANVKWTNHGYKHFAQKNLSWKAVIKSTKNGGPARYLHGTDIEAVERFVWANGTPVTNGKDWKVFKFDQVVGASDGKETQYIRVEHSGGTIHGHPITVAEYKKLTK